MIIGDRERPQIVERLKGLVNPVKIIYFTQEFECDYCRETGQLMRELSGLSDKIGFEEYNFQVDRNRVIDFEIDKIPATVIMSEDKDYGIRFYGVPLGYEFVSVLEALLDVSRCDSGLKPETRQKLKAVDKPLRMQVLVTPTCPYCPAAVRLAHKFAMENDLITGEMVEVTEFPYLATKYRVAGVPMTVVNDAVFIEGARPEQRFLEEVLSALGPREASG